MTTPDNTPPMTQELLGVTSQLCADDNLKHAIGVNALHTYYVSGRGADAEFVLNALQQTRPERAASAVITLLDTTDTSMLTPDQIDSIITHGYASLERVDATSDVYTQATFSLITLVDRVKDELAKREKAIERSPLETLEDALIVASKAFPHNDTVEQALKEPEIKKKWLILDTPVVSLNEQSYINLFHDRLAISLLERMSLEQQLILFDSRPPKSDEGAIAIAQAHDTIVLGAATTSDDPNQAFKLLDRGARRPKAQTYFDDLHDTILIRALRSSRADEQFLPLLARTPKTPQGKQKIQKILDERNGDTIDQQHTEE